MQTVTIEFPESVLLNTGQTRDEFVHEAKFLLTAKLFELGRLSSGKAAQVCGMQRIDFIFAIGKLGIPVTRLEDDEFQREFQDCD